MKALNQRWIILSVGLACACALGGCGRLGSGRARAILRQPQNVVRIERVERLDQPPRGPRSAALFGDYVMSAPGLKLAFSAPEHKIGDMVSGGFLIDVARDDAPLDFLECLAPVYAGLTSPTYRVTAMAVEREWTPLGRQPVLVARGEDPERVGVTVETRYVLDPRANILTVTTTLTNKSVDPLRELELGDLMHWGYLQPIAENVGLVSQHRRSKTVSPWIAGAFDNLSLGLFPAGADGENELIRATHLGDRSRLSQRRVAELPVGQSLTWSRCLRIGDRRLALISNEYYHRHLGGAPVGEEGAAVGVSELSGRAIDARTSEPAVGAQVSFVRLPANREEKPTLASMTYTDELGQFSILAPAGNYQLMLDPPGRPSQGYRVELRVNAPVHQLFLVGPESGINYEVYEKGGGELLPCKFVITGVGSTPTPYFGAMHQMPSAGNVHFSATGKGSFPLRPGDYQVEVLRGTEYLPARSSLTVKPGEQNKVKIQLLRQIDTSGWVSVDLGTRTNRSYDCSLTPEERVVTALAEGVEFLISGDVNTVTDLRPVIAKMNAGKYVGAETGIRIKPMGLGAFGEYMVFPVADEPVAGLPLHERLRRQGKDTWAMTSLLRQAYPQSVIGLGNAFDPHTGYFTRFGYVESKEEVLISSKRISYDFDLLETYAHDECRLESHGYHYYYDLAAHGITPHYYGYSKSRLPIYEEIGYPRMYVRSSTDDPARIDPAEITRNIKAGRVQISNGPFIRVTINGEDPGATIHAPDGQYRFSLRVESPQYAYVSLIQLEDNGTFLKGFTRAPQNSHVIYPVNSDASEFSRMFKEDVQICLFAMGAMNIEPAAKPALKSNGSLPKRVFAMTGPFNIDVDGDGVCRPPNRVLILDQR